MLNIGLTGGVASGKSMVSRYFEQLGIPVIDTDIISKQLVEPGQSALTEISRIFGYEIIDKNSKLKRKLLREIIFKSPSKRQQLEAILHPKIQAVVLQELALLEQQNNTTQKIPYCIIVIPLLFESKLTYPIDKILLIDCSEQQQIERTMLRDTVTREQALAIINNQASRTERMEKAHDIINNNTDIDSCFSQIHQIHDNYLKLSKSPASKNII